MSRQRFSPVACISFLSLVLAVAAKSKTKKASSLIRRIIVGIIVAVIGFCILIFVCCWLMTRRRRAPGVAAGEPNPGHFYPASTGPMGGGPPPGPGYNNHAGGPPQPYNSEYPVADAMPAPAYEKESNIPPGYPPTGHQHQNQGGYAPPLGPPPPAHTTGQDGNFVGGFKG